MPRPSRNIDELLLQTGRELLAESGASALSIRRLTRQAGVNLGMFHYHFKSRENFIRTLLQQMYDEMFASLSVQVERQQTSYETLRSAVRVLARFGRDNRRLLLRISLDALNGEVLAAQFLQSNLPRHVQVIIGLIVAGQNEGVLRKLPVMQALAFLAGSVAAPILMGTAAVASGLIPAAVTAQLEAEMLSDEAIDQRIDMALHGLSLRNASAVERERHAS
jgi:AcrR family transcriptional regulator